MPVYLLLFSPRILMRPASASRPKPSREIAAQHHGGLGRAPLRVVAGTAADLAKAGAGIEPTRRLVVLVDLEEDGARTQAREPGEMQREQAARQAATAKRACDRDRQYFGFV